MNGFWPRGCEVYMLDELTHRIVPEFQVLPALPPFQQSGSYSPARLEYHVAVFGKSLIVSKKQSLAVFGMSFAGIYREVIRTNFCVPWMSLLEIFAAK
jgi:hypothetical protein